MGYCLYGNDINESVTPIEANLGWITKVETNFIGSKSIKEQIENGIKKKIYSSRENHIGQFIS